MTGADKQTILVVEDLTSARKVLCEYLTELGYEVLQARDAESSLELMHDHSVDGFLLDIFLPGIDGIALCRRIRSFERFKHTPVLFITSSEDPDVLRDAFAVGGDDLVNKPVTQAVLGARLKNQILCKARLQQLDYMQRNLNLYVCPRTQEMAEIQVRTGRLPPPQTREVCVLFSDVRGFTQLSQEVDPKLLFSVLSETLGAQVRFVYRYDGYIDKFSGDGIMAVFDGPDMVRNSCQCALKIIEHAKEESARSVAELYQLGVGLHMGKAMIGNIGTERQLDYTVVGPTVNLAARLCGHADALSVVVSEEVKSVLQNDPCFQFSDAMALSVKGVRSPVSAYVMSRGEKACMPQQAEDVDALPI